MNTQKMTKRDYQIVADIALRRMQGHAYQFATKKVGSYFCLLVGKQNSREWRYVVDDEGRILSYKTKASAHNAAQAIYEGGDFKLGDIYEEQPDKRKDNRKAFSRKR